MGYASVLVQNAQHVEMAASALQGIIMKMYQDPGKLARIAGIDVKEFARLVREDANEALLQLLDTLGKAGGMQALAPMFDEMKLDGQFVRQTFLRPETQSKLGTEGYDAGAKLLADFIKEQVAQFVCDDLDPLGKEIIDCCLHDGTLDDYLALTPMKLK